MRAARHASITRWSRRPMRVYFSRTYSRSLPAYWLMSVKKATTVCMPFTSVNLRLER